MPIEKIELWHLDTSEVFKATERARAVSGVDVSLSGHYARTYLRGRKATARATNGGQESPDVVNWETSN
jgi:hypothetical protein